ncbi:VOC family protein [Nostoc sp.]|uniref:VOC family protein n=1 Tax=Nostoc sp. TaxID=1180 RepID=UPI002FF77A0A
MFISVSSPFAFSFLPTNGIVADPPLTRFAAKGIVQIYLALLSVLTRILHHKDLASLTILRSAGIKVSQPKRYPEYHPEYYAIFFDDPDGIRLEIVAKTSARQALELRWDELKEFLNPLQTLPKSEFHNA